jgi:hypothetical protein
MLNYFFSSICVNTRLSIFSEEALFWRPQSICQAENGLTCEGGRGTCAGNWLSLMARGAQAPVATAHPSFLTTLHFVGGSFVSSALLSSPAGACFNLLSRETSGRVRGPRADAVAKLTAVTEFHLMVHLRPLSVCTHTPALTEELSPPHVTRGVRTT